MKSFISFLLFSYFVSLSQAASLKRAQYFASTEDFYQSYTALTRPYDLMNQTLVGGPYIDYKTKEEFVVIEVENEKCKLVTFKRTKNISCSKAINKRSEVRIPLLLGFNKASSSQLDYLTTLNDISYEAKVSVYDPYTTNSDFLFTSTLDFEFSSDFKSLKLTSITDAGSTLINNYPTLNIKDVQYKKDEKGEFFAIWVDQGIPSYSQKADKGAITYLNPKLFNVKTFEDLVDVSRDSAGNVIGVSAGFKDDFKPLIKRIDFHYMIISRALNESKFSIQFQQSFENKGNFSAEYSVK
ncbi:MAG: hypothetical protein QE271_10655 [Bacteriovoracaceae bacterium]|nr:hypothetical protein [Bacteriovoracaceae bacterium]